MALRALARGLIVLAAAWSPVAPAAVLPQIDSFPSAAPLVVRYDLFFNGIFAAEVTETLSTDGAGAYRIESEARARGLAKILIGDILRKSEGLWEGESLRPLLYEEIRGKKRHYRAVVDRARETIDLIRKTTGRAETAPLPAAPLNDYLTAAYRSYAAGRALADESALTDGRRIKTYRYRAGSEESIDTVFGALRAVPVFRVGERRVVVWLAPALRFLPARTEIETGVGKLLIKIAAVESPSSAEKT